MIILSNEGTVNTIYHISDIHIRTTDERYQEYNEIFEAFCGEVDNKNFDALIVITGDILHSKTQLTPKCVKELINFIIMLTNMSDVIMILGNHDVPINNNLEDNIINIISCKNFETKNKIHVLTANDIYMYKNLIFGNTLVYSSYTTPCKIIDANKIKIALYHGMIVGSKKNEYTKLSTPHDETMVSSHDTPIKLSDFDDYDIGMFGDIHIHQFLDKDNKFGYAGSMIQQNFGESIKKGYIKWDMSTKTGKFVHIQNKTGFVTFDLTHELPTINISHKYSHINNIHARLMCNDVSQHDINLAETTLRSKFNLIECMVTRENTVTNQPDEQSTDLVENVSSGTIVPHDDEIIRKDTILSDDDIINLFDVSIKKIYPNNDLNDEILKYIKDEVNALEYSYNSEHKKISLEKIKFKNLFIYGKGNVVNFKNLNGIIGLVSPNFTGKSSIIDALLFALYEKSSRGIRSQCVNISKTLFSSEIKINVNNDNYVITRKGQRQTSKNTTASVNITKNDELIECDDKLHHNNFVNNTICDYERFIDNSIMLQTNTGFIDRTEEERKKFLFHILNLDILHQLYKKIKSDMAKTKFYISRLNKDIDDVNEKIKEFESPRKLEEKQLIIMYDLELLYADRLLLSNIYAKYEDVTCNNKKVCYSEEEYQCATVALSVIKNDIINTSREISVLRPQLNDINRQLALYDETEVNNKNLSFCEMRDNTIAILHNYIDELNIIKPIEEKEDVGVDEIPMITDTQLQILDKVIANIKEIDLLEQNMNNLDVELKETQDKYNGLKNHEFNPNCEYCMKNSMTIEKQFLDTKIKRCMEKIDVINHRMSVIKQFIVSHQSDIHMIDKYNKLKQRYGESLIEKFDNLKMHEKEKTISEIKTLRKMSCKEYDMFNELRVGQIEIEKNIIMCENKLISLKATEKESISIINSFEQDIELKQNIDIRNNINEAIAVNDKKIKKYESKLSSIEAQYNDIEHFIKMRDTYSTQIDEQNKLVKKYGMLLEIYTKHNIIDNIVCEKIVPELETGVNDLLKTIVNFKIKMSYNGCGIVVERECISHLGDICEHEIPKRINAKLLSGFEHDVLNLIFKIKFNQMNVFTKTDFLILDEVLSSADESHLNKLENLFIYIKEHYKWCLLITHLGILKNYFTKTISIEQHDGESKIVV